MRSIWLLFLICFCCSCKTTEEATKKDEPLPDSEFNFRQEQDLVLLFSQLDYNMREWNEAKRKGDDASISFFERELLEQSRGNLDILMETLKNKDNQSYRVISAMALGFTQSPKALPILVDTLNDANSAVVQNCLQSIGFMGIKETPIPPLVSALNSGNGKIKAFAAYAIGETITPKREFHGADQLLIGLLNHEDMFVRLNSVSALGKMQSVPAVKPIIASNLYHEYPRVRLAAIAALGNIEHLSASAGLIESLKDENEKVRKRALWALKRITKKDYGDDRDSWRNWYESNKDDLQ